MGSTKNSYGFTIVELLISITLLGIISVSLLAIITNYFANVTRTNIFVEMTNDSQNLLRSVVEEIRYGAGVRQTNTITDANEPGGGWNTSNTNFVIVIAIPVKDSSGEFVIDALTGNPYNNEYVYYKNGSTLYKRILANPSATGNIEVTTCPEATASPSCPADIKYLDFLEDMVFVLYDQDNGVTTDATAARSVEINLSMSRDTFGEPLVLDNSIRVTLRNNFQ